MEFKPSIDVMEILKTLNQIGFQWIGKEIELNIRNGKTENKEIENKSYEKPLFDSEVPTYKRLGVPQRRKTKISAGELVSIPFNEDEQVLIALKTIKAYFVELHDVWSNVQQNITKIPNVEIKVMIVGEENSEEPLVLFPPEFNKHLVRLDNLLKQALSDEE